MSAFGFSFDNAVVVALGWTLLHFLWQGALVAAVLAAIDALAARGRPQIRYLAACAAMLLLFAMPLATFVTTRAAAPRDAARAGSPSQSMPGGQLVSHDRMDVAPLVMAAGAAPHGAARPAPHSIPAPVLPFGGTRGVDLAFLLPWLVAAWSLGVLALSLRLAGGWWLARRMARSAGNATLEHWNGTLGALRERMRITRPVRLVRSALVSVPTVVGWLRPVILLPASTMLGLSPAQIEAVLAHELAHVRRHDYVVNLLQCVIETVLFYHPAVWWVSRRVREERELCCDDLAVQTCGDPVVYARALCELEELRGATLQTAMAATGGSLVARIARLVGASRPRSIERTQGFAWVLVASLVLFVGAAGGAVRVHDRPVAAQLARLVRQAVRPAPDAAVVSTTSAPAAATKCETSGTGCPQARMADGTDRTDVSDTADAPVACDAPDPADVTPTQDASVAPEAPEAPDAPDGVAAPLPPMPPGSAASSDRFSPRDRERLSSAGVNERYVDNLARNGYPALTVDELMRLAQHGVMSAYAGTMVKLFDSPGVADLVALADHGVSSRYAAAMRRELPRVDVPTVIELADNGISAEYLSGMRELDLGDLSPADLIRLANNGVTLEWFASLRWMGYADFTVDRAIELRNAGVTADYAASLRILSRHRLTLEELRTLRNQGVDVEYAATILGMLRKDLSVDQLVRLRNQDVTVDYIAAMNALGYEKLGTDDLIELRQTGVDPEFVAEMAGAGFSNLSSHDLVRLHQTGVTLDFIQEVRDAGYPSPSVSDLVHMRQSGIPTPNRP